MAASDRRSRAGRLLLLPPSYDRSLLWLWGDCDVEGQVIRIGFGDMNFLELQMYDEEGVLEIRPVFEAEDFGEAFTPELQAREDRLRVEMEKQQKK